MHKLLSCSFLLNGDELITGHGQGTIKGVDYRGRSKSPIKMTHRSQIFY